MKKIRILLFLMLCSILILNAEALYGGYNPSACRSADFPPKGWNNCPLAYTPNSWFSSSPGYNSTTVTSTWSNFNVRFNESGSNVLALNVTIKGYSTNTFRDVYVSVCRGWICSPFYTVDLTTINTIHEVRIPFATGWSIGDLANGVFQVRVRSSPVSPGITYLDWIQIKVWS